MFVLRGIIRCLDPGGIGIDLGSISAYFELLSINGMYTIHKIKELVLLMGLRPEIMMT